MHSLRWYFLIGLLPSVIACAPGEANETSAEQDEALRQASASCVATEWTLDGKSTVGSALKQSLTKTFVKVGLESRVFFPVTSQSAGRPWYRRLLSSVASPP